MLASHVENYEKSCINLNKSVRVESQIDERYIYFNLRRIRIEFKKKLLKSPSRIPNFIII